MEFTALKNHGYKTCTKCLYIKPGISSYCISETCFSFYCVKQFIKLYMSAMNTYNRTAIDNDRLANIVYTPGYIPQTLISSVDFYTAIAATKVTIRALWEL